MGRARETFGKRENRTKQEKKRKEKEAKRLEKKESSRDGNNLDEMIAYVDEFGRITSTPPDLTKRVAVNVEDIQIGVPKYVEPGAGEILRTGIVAFFNESKGYGFINDSLSGKSVFVHANGIVEPIKENNKVSFEVVDGPKGPNAVNVKLIK